MGDTALEPWNTVLGLALLEGQRDWRLCVSPRTHDVVVVNGEVRYGGRTVVLLQHPRIQHMMDIIPGLRMFLVGMQHEVDSQVLRVAVTVLPDYGGFTFTRLLVQVHGPNFDEAMTRMHLSFGHNLLCRWLSAVGPNYLLCRFQTLHESVHSQPLDTTQAILPADSVWKLPLLDSQKESLLWMQCFEAVLGSANSVECPTHFPLPGTSYVYCFFSNTILPQEVVTPTSAWSRIPYYGGILADGTGSGKTAVALALITSQPRRLSHLDLLSQRTVGETPGTNTQQLLVAHGWSQVAMHVPTCASLIVVPHTLSKQWMGEVEKFVNTTQVKVIKIFNKRDLDSTSMKAVQEADMVLTSMHFLQGAAYRRCVADRDPESLHRYYATKARRGELDEHHPLFLQAFFWRRIIYDEQHDIVHQRSTVALLNQLKAEVYWGLTATPVLDRNNFVYNLHFRHVPLLPMFNKELVSHAVRQTVTSLQSSAHPVEVHEHLVPIVERERAMLEAYRNRGLEALVQLATCFNVVSLFGTTGEEDGVIATMTFDTLARTMVAKHRSELKTANAELVPLTQHVAELREHMTQLGIATDAADAETGSVLVRSLQRQLKVALRRQARKQAEVRSLEMQSEFFVSQLSQRGTICPICFDAEVNVVTDCGHWFCKPCVTSYFRNRHGCGPCPVCKRELVSQQYIEVADEHAKKEVAEGAAAQPDMVEVYGSKLAAIVTLLRQLKSRGEKAVMFMQWTALMRTVRSLLLDGGVQACAVYGNLNMVNAALEKFYAGEADVLLLSLETSTAGLNLVHANHVIFAHALVNGGVTWQNKLVEQAVGRVNRLGQDKQVHVHWFITEDTDEHNVYRAYERVRSDGEPYDD